MPTSYWGFLSEVVHLVREIQPESVLDIGCGFGKWGVLLREYLELWGPGRPAYDPADWKRRIDAVEIWPQYVLAHHCGVYSHVYRGDVVEILPRLDAYELILAMDVLEHVERPAAEWLLRRMREKAGTVILQVPLGLPPQGPAFGNPYETHRSSWELSDFPGAIHKARRAPSGRRIGLVVYQQETGVHGGQR
jgi:SAM-dependent methyltransferase